MDTDTFGAEQADYWERLRSRLIPLVHPILAKYGLYAEMDASVDEYLATVPCAPERFERYLADWGFTRNPVAGYKTRWDGVEEVGSWRRCYTEQENGSIVPGDVWSKWQLHVRLFPGPTPDTVDVHVHWEVNWLYDPFAHYAGEGKSVQVGHRRMSNFLDRMDAHDHYRRGDLA